jgi:dTDP-4-amino-4,6-dideoxygalactose transaminase
MKVPMLDLRLEYEYMKEDIDCAIRGCLDHQKWILGPEVEALERRVSDYIGVKHCVGVSSGSDALVLSLRALAIKLRGKEYFDRSDRVITTPFTFTATGDAVLRSGATPLFVDIDPATYNVDAENIRRALSDRSVPGKVIGIIPVHLYGQSCQMGEIMAIAQEHDLFVVEDVAQAFGGTWKDRKLGSIGTMGAFSFFPSKNLGGFGDGGMMSTNDAELSDVVRMLLKHGGKDKYNVDHVGYNARLDTFQASILLAKLKYLDEFNTLRRNVAQIYTDRLNGLQHLTLPHSDGSQTGNGHVFHQYTVRVASGHRDKLQRCLQDRGVSTAIYYPFPLHKMRVFGNGLSARSGQVENAERACLEVLSLPIEPLQNKEKTGYVADCVAEYFSKAAKGTS